MTEQQVPKGQQATPTNDHVLVPERAHQVRTTQSPTRAEQSTVARQKGSVR